MLRSPWLLPAVFVLMLASIGSIVIGMRDVLHRSEPVRMPWSARP